MTEAEIPEPPESDPYCAHWWSIFDEDTECDGVPHPLNCEACGHSCHDHPATLGAGAQCAVDECECRRFVNAKWPAEETSP